MKEVGEKNIVDTLKIEHPDVRFFVSFFLADVVKHPKKNVFKIQILTTAKSLPVALPKEFLPTGRQKQG